MIVRPLHPEDRDALVRFLAQVPDDDRNFFKQDVSDPEVVQRWLDDTNATRLVGVDDDGEIAAELAIVRGVGRWPSS